MGLFQDGAEEPKMRRNRYVITGVVLAVLITLGVRYVLRFHGEKKAVEQFFNVLVAGDIRKSYEVWVPAAAGGVDPTSGYTFQDFVSDWGPTGFYGPVKSYQIQTAQQPDGGSGVIVVVSVSPYETFPDSKDAEKHRRTKEVRLWVERSDKSLSFAPPS